MGAIYFVNNACPNGFLDSTDSGVSASSDHSGASVPPSQNSLYSHIAKVSRYMYSLVITFDVNSRSRSKLPPYPSNP